MRLTILLLAAIALAGCGKATDDTPEKPAMEPKAATDMPAKAMRDDSLEAVLARQPDDVRARYAYRHPQQTLEFFGIEPGMTVVEGLPGGGWYTSILIPYLGEQGKVIGADYELEMFRNFSFGTDEFIEERKTWVTDWPADAKDKPGADGASVAAFVFGQLPNEMHGTADAVVLMRVLHNLARFESDGNYLTTALQNIYDVLKPGGTVGIVQHHARDGMPDEWAGGQNGYLKKDFVIQAMQDAGFELVSSSDINANPKDQPSETDIVWRLPPSLATSEDNPELRAELEAIGESNRMTLKFRKPAI